MPSFSRRSLDRLRTCNRPLQKTLHGVVAFFDCTILTGHRGEEAQNAAFEGGNSGVEFPDSRHNIYPSEAVDAAPYDADLCDVDWDIKVVEDEHRHLVRWGALWNLCRFFYFGGTVVGYARALGTKIRYGGDWDGDGELDDQKFRDLVHFETKN